MSIITNYINTPPHNILVLDSKQVPYATKELLDDLLLNTENTIGVKRNNYYIINTDKELLGYPSDKKEYVIFDKLLYRARFRRYSCIMIKFDTV